MTDHQEPDLQPDIGDVLQEEHDYATPVVDVSVQGPVRVQALPLKGGATRTLTVGEPRRILTADPRRGRVQLLAHDQDVRVAFSQVSAGHPSTMARWTKGVPLMVAAAVEVWVGSAVEETTELSVVVENWAEGE